MSGDLLKIFLLARNSGRTQTLSENILPRSKLYLSLDFITYLSTLFVFHKCLSVLYHKNLVVLTLLC